MVTKSSSHKAQQAAASSKVYAWHAHESTEVLAVLGVSETGLQHGDVLKRRQKYGRNEFTQVAKTGIFKRLLSQLTSPLAFVLVVAFVITFALQEFVDAGVICFALAIAVIVGVLQEGKASNAFAKLAASQEATATVLRDGGKHVVPASELVPGDIVELQNGMQVPADVRLLKSKKLEINEAALTGEWRAIDKTTKSVPVGTLLADQTSMAWLGTFVANGFGVGVVVATGDQTSMGSLAASLQNQEEVETPLQAQMHRLSMVMLYIIGALVLAVFVIGLWQGQSVHDMLLMSIAIAVASVPEGLPAAVTIILAVGMESLLKRGGLVRNLLAAETLGSTTYVLTDKTGTLTEARMALNGVVYAQTANLDPGSWKKNSGIIAMLQTALFAIDAYVDTSKRKDVLRGDAIEKSILEIALQLQLTTAKKPHHKTRLDYLPFTSEHRYAAGLVESDGDRHLCINGAPEHLLAQATHMYTNDGPRKITPEDREQYEADIALHARAGKRLIGVAQKHVDFEEIPDDVPANLIKNCVFMGVLIFADPVRSGVSKAIAGVKDAGAEVILITGDSEDTALAIARKVGIAGDSETALTGADLANLTDEELLEAVQHVHVFARVLPAQKMRIATVLQAAGEIVAMTGDGINDAPALKRAHIGIAIGSGTEVAKESSDLVLVNDSFAIIYAAIEEGRRIIANLQKIVGYLLSTSLSEVFLIGAALLVGAPPPILPAQILWANVIEEGLMSVAFAFEPGDKNAMKRSPQDIHEEGIFSGTMMWFVFFVVSVLSMMIVALFFYLRALNVPLEQLRSALFLAISLDSLFMSFAFRSLLVPIWHIPLKSNLFFLGSFILSASLLLIVLTVPFFQYLLSYTPLPGSLLFLVFIFSIGSLATVEFGKWVFMEK